MQVDERLISWFRFYLFGRFILGVSHEVDNYLSVVLGFAELIKINPSNEEKVIKSSEKIINSASSLSRMMKKYSFYLREQQEEDLIFDIRETIDELITFAGYDLKRNNVEIKTEMPDEGFLLRGNKRDFAFILINIMINASESMTSGGGCQTIELSRDEDNIVITVSDEGEGIPHGLSEKVFETGFTTKGESYRLGLGLPVSRYLAKKIGATISFTSEAGKGTEFTIRVPSQT